MKNFRILAAVISLILCTSFTSCEYDDSAIWDQVENLLKRVQELEAKCEQQNSNIVALQTLLNSIKDNVYVTSVSEMDNQKGYFLEFSNGKKISIYHGEDGEDGRDGETPSLTIIKEGDNYYWSVNGEILKDETGNGITAGGNDTSSPILKTGSQLEADGVDGTWEKDVIYVSIDNTTWTKVVTGGDTSIFTSVTISENNQIVIITLSDGSVINIPKTEKILSMLYGKWGATYNVEDDEYNEIWTFNEDMTFEIYFNEFGGYTEKGTYKFLPDRYIALYCPEEGWDEVYTIASISDTNLYIVGEGTFTRIRESQNLNNNGEGSHGNGSSNNAGGGITNGE